MVDGSLSLYFRLSEGKSADLEVVAAAALHWVNALKAAAEAIEPGAQIRVELIDADEASLKLNTTLRWIEDHLSRIEYGSGKYPRLRALAIALALFLGQQTVTQLIDAIDPPSVSLNEEDRRLLQKLLERTKKSSSVREESQKFFRTIERERAITDVGVSEKKSSPPVLIIPRNQFPERGGLWRLEEEEQERTRHLVMDVTLIGPVLIASPRAWTFQPEGLPPFKAIMKDPNFLSAIKRNHVRERLREGIQMTIRLEVKEQRRGSAWEAKRKGRSVIEVISPGIG